MALECAVSVDVAPDRVSFALSVVNGGVEPVAVTFRDAGRADFAVLTDGSERWRWSEGRMVAQVTETVRLAPGESFDATAEWPDPTPGEHVVEAELRATPTCRVRTAFTV